MYRKVTGAASYMMRNEDLTYDTRLPSSRRARIILGDGSITKVQFIGKVNLV